MLVRPNFILLLFQHQFASVFFETPHKVLPYMMLGIFLSSDRLCLTALGGYFFYSLYDDWIYDEPYRRRALEEADPADLELIRLAGGQGIVKRN